jgi:hypothetical protein
MMMMAHTDIEIPHAIARKAAILFKGFEIIDRSQLSALDLTAFSVRRI